MNIVHFGDPSLPESFWERVQPEYNSGCWLWTGTVSETGYGNISVNGRSRAAHRYAYENAVAPIPAELVTDHLCRNRCCVNPQHLEPVTVRENNLRGVGAPAINSQKTHCKRGHEFTPENTKPQGHWRMCRTCVRDQANARTKLKSLARTPVMTQSQRAFILSLSGEWQLPCALKPPANSAVTGYRDRTLVEVKRVVSINRKFYRLTPRGLQVQAELVAAEKITPEQGK